MEVRIKLMRKAGRWLTWNQLPEEATGRLYTRNAGKNDDAMMVSIGMAGGGPQLYDPKLKSFSGSEIVLVGLEKVDHCWVLQEWKCEIINLS